jgi:macrodomain Ter protein organizer (MatP/YcbG family)
VKIVIQRELRSKEVSNPTKKRLSIDLPMEFHQCLLDIANKHNMTMTHIVTAMIIQLIKQEGLHE